MGTPLVEICRIHWLDTAAKLCTPPRLPDVGLGISAPTSALNVGAEAAPVVGPAQTALADWVASVPVSVPEPVMGEPVTVNIAGRDRATLLTVPEPAVVHDVLPEPSVFRT